MYEYLGMIWFLRGVPSAADFEVIWLIIFHRTARSKGGNQIPVKQNTFSATLSRISRRKPKGFNFRLCAAAILYTVRHHRPCRLNLLSPRLAESVITRLEHATDHPSKGHGCSHLPGTSTHSTRLYEYAQYS